jgi:hypothetical protein
MQLIDIIKQYPKGTAIIRYRLDGKIKDWPISATEKDDTQSLKEHLEKWIPGAVFIDYIFKA